MKKLTLVLLLLTPFMIPPLLYAVTYPFPENSPAYLQNETVLKTGTKLYLFHSGTEEVKKTININKILVVYREYPPELSLEPRETGKVRILSSSGEYYFEAEVIEGKVQPGYLARKGTVACFITSFKKKGALGVNSSTFSANEMPITEVQQKNGEKS